LYQGCQNDTAYNLLIDPNGDQTLCSDTNLQPDDTDQLSTWSVFIDIYLTVKLANPNSPIQKNQLSSGNWSVVVITNNGDGEQAAYERDFYLSVGQQSTVTVICPSERR